MSVANQTMSLERVHHLEPYVDPTPVDFNCAQAVGRCLIENGDYQGYECDSNFTDADILTLAVEDAQNIIDTRNARLRRNLLTLVPEPPAGDKPEHTVYVVSRSLVKPTLAG